MGYTKLDPEFVSTYDIRQLRLGNQVLSFSPDQLMLQRDKARTRWILVFELGNLICDLLTLIARRLNRSFHVPNLLQDTAVILEVLGKNIFLLAHLSEHNAELVGDVGDVVVVSALTPFRELGGNRGTLTTSCLVGANSGVLALDQLGHLFAQLGCLHPAEGRDAEPMSVRGGLSARAEGEVSVPIGVSDVYLGVETGFIHYVDMMDTR